MINPNSEIQIQRRANTDIKKVEVGSGAQDKKASPADRSHTPCAHCIFMTVEIFSFVKQKNRKPNFKQSKQRMKLNALQ